MRKIIFLITILVSIFGCSNNDDELKVETSIWYIARNTMLGDNKITATFYFFEDDDYDPTTFLFNLNLQSLKDGAELTTTSGKKVKSFFIDIVLKDDRGMGKYNCSPGSYYVITSIGSGINMQWKAKRITVSKNNISNIEVIFKDENKTGYTE